MSNDVLSHAYNPAEGANILSEALMNNTSPLEAAHVEDSDVVYMDVLDRIRTCD